MTHAKNKVEWCLKKAERELKETGRHKGLVKTAPNKKKSREHISKAEHNLKLTLFLKSTEFSDWCASTTFYSIYHALLSILENFGYESGNQECTFATIYSLIEDKKIDIKKETIDKIAEIELDKLTARNAREIYQYGTKFSIPDDIYTELVDITMEVIETAKVAVEK